MLQIVQRKAWFGLENALKSREWPGLNTKVRHNLASLGDGGLVLVKHEAELDLEGIIEVARVKINELLRFIETVNESVAVNVELVGSVGKVEATGKEGLHGFEELLIPEQR